MQDGQKMFLLQTSLSDRVSLLDCRVPSHHLFLPPIKDTVAKATSPSSIEDWIQVINHIDKIKLDAKEAIKYAYKILLEIYSKQRYPLKEL